MKKRSALFFFLMLGFLLSGCGESPTYTDYTGYLTPGSQGTTANSAPDSSVQPDYTFSGFGQQLESAFGSLAGQQENVPGSPASSATPPQEADPQSFANVVTIISSPTPAPVPTAAPVPTTPPTPAPTPVPTPEANLVRITKSPTSETVEEGGSAIFIAYADNSTGIVWITVSPDKQSSYQIGDAVRVFPGLNVSGQGTSTLSLSNIPYAMDGWRIQAYFNGNGGPLYTAGAYLTVIPAGSSSSGIYVTSGTADNAENSTAIVARQAYSDITSYASAYGYTVGSMDGYSYSNAIGDFNVTVSNVKCRITTEFKAYYYSNSNYGYGPVHVNIYNQLGELLYSEHLTDKNISYYVTILDTYK